MEAGLISIFIDPHVVNVARVVELHSSYFNALRILFSQEKTFKYVTLMIKVLRDKIFDYRGALK